MKKKAVFLDRDGVLNKAIIKNGKPYPPASIEEMELTTDVKEALQILKNAGFMLIGATNQPDVARGKTSRSVVDAINNKLLAELALDEINTCFHDDYEACECRKPLPGLITEAAKRFDIDLEDSFMIGDRWKDVQAGHRAGCKTIWLDYQYQENYLGEKPTYQTTTLMDAVNWIIKNN